MVRGGRRGLVCARGLHVLHLSGYGRDMFLTCGSLFLGRRTHVDPTIAAVVADASQRRVVDHGGVVDVVNLSDVHVVHRTIVIKTSVVPTPAFITAAEVTVAIVDSPIQPYTPP